ncbi:hypothetical protein PMI09_01285 [Rhizobium sp. CF122]|nr:hypothetical protein PMI09_01285 [Rhizobium sp. CF122]
MSAGELVIRAARLVICRACLPSTMSSTQLIQSWTAHMPKNGFKRSSHSPA